ncbi:mannose-1-phosphate guanylyltransferase/mannose-1-phosphate guanylyltransferase / mannose-6-phosphate isomerase [Ectothiorhodospira mobilis]|uniref:mannose-1-phosphate guanylyltransferase n=1 Tax=Ectothiorhodospira mobilis TaxID=195064 RepID=A0A1I4QHP3_ECTMO|nr:mannose-1-phosphate guanylyltransferase/mannose-6-phosphate isomerase [Ectothiorhodospira mobilis]SFM39180.1 mannose-1-phosphate guanylyltransferase/mannose-1-phosphate guanylyltransferase / mannose-6-phosphate isomerase [Ectothiorhodospira mobilis]
MTLIPVILSGGAGTRLWPMSRQLYPKQFLNLTGTEHTLLQATLARLPEADVAPPLIICNEAHRFLVAEQLRQMGVRPGGILLEPVGRNTAPAVAAAALCARASGEDPVLLVMPADHLIQDVDAFRRSVALAVEAARSGELVTFGVPPTEPHTGYGYIRVEAGAGAGAAPVREFVEKPDLDTARAYVASGQYYWNSGIFVFRASSFLEELKAHAPDILEACERAWAGARGDLDFLRLEPEAFSACRSESLDYAVMEPTRRAVMVPLEADWSDVGSWTALWSAGERDAEGNVAVGDVLLTGTRNCYLHADARLVAAVGVEDLVVVETKDAVLVMHKDHHQDVKEIVARLRADGREESENHRCVARPWGTYEQIDTASRFQVKRITVKPGQQLSLQMHYHRAEHWIVVRGTARITRGEEQFILSENESTYIPLGITHRLENPGRIPLELIEVQSGSYLGEDDIVRFEDTYGRH